MKNISVFLLFFGFIACSDNKTASVKTAKAKIKSLAIQNPVVKYGIEGFYTGSFEAIKFDESKNFNSSNKITISIDSLDDQLIYGHSIVAGNERPFSGSYSKANNKYTATIKEPGDDKYDGVFIMTLEAGSKKLQGIWSANDNKLAVTERQYELEQKVFQYNPSLELPEEIVEEPIANTYNEETEKQEAITEDVLKLNASKKLLTEKDIQNMYRADLEVIRNAIYARHGYSFKNIRMRTIFDNYVPWYMPVSTNVSAYLTETEQKNIALIKRYEQHAARYYDAFGR
jgi:YARHG domain